MTPKQTQAIRDTYGDMFLAIFSYWRCSRRIPSDLHTAQQRAVEMFGPLGMVEVLEPERRSASGSSFVVGIVPYQSTGRNDDYFLGRTWGEAFTRAAAHIAYHLAVRDAHRTRKGEAQRLADQATVSEQDYDPNGETFVVQVTLGAKVVGARGATETAARARLARDLQWHQLIGSDYPSLFSLWAILGLPEHP